MSPRVINDQGRAIVMAHESCRLEAYVCPAGRLAIGYGHTGDVKKGDRITAHQAEAILEVDLHRFEMAVERLAPNSGPNEFSACVSLAFNIGVDAFTKSTLLKMHNAGLNVAAAAQFAKWTHAAGKVLPGLVKRRAAEAALYLTPVS